MCKEESRGCFGCIFLSLLVCLLFVVGKRQNKSADSTIQLILKPSIQLHSCLSKVPNLHPNGAEATALAPPISVPDGPDLWSQPACLLARLRACELASECLSRSEGQTLSSSCTCLQKAKSISPQMPVGSPVSLRQMSASEE